jgi:hypothetical protein
MFSIGNLLSDIATLGGSYFTREANQSQIDSANQALDLQLAEQKRINEANAAAANEAQRLLANSSNATRNYLSRYGGKSLAAIDQATSDQINALTGGGQQAIDALNSQYGNAQNYLGQGYGQSLGSIKQGTQQAIDALYGSQQGYRQGLNEGLAGALGEISSGLNESQLAGLYSSEYTPSADYEFRRQQGEQSLNRLAAARGGRHGGAQLKALSDFNQNLASQDYSDWSNRQQNVASAIDAQQMNAANQAAQALYGYGSNLAGGQQSLASQLGNLYTGSGQQLGNLATGYGSQLGTLQSALGQNIGNITQNNASNIANLYDQSGQQKSALLSNLGANLANTQAQRAAGQANLLTGNAANAANLTQALLPAYQAPTQYAGQVQAAQGQAYGNIGDNLFTLGLIGNNKGWF